MANPFEDHYGILGVKQNATFTEIKAAYFKLQRIWHPDKNPNQNKQGLEFCKKLNISYSVLSNATKRKEYDSLYNNNKSKQQTHNSQSQKQENNRSHQKEQSTSSNNQNHKNTNHKNSEEGKKNQNSNNKQSKSNKRTNQKEQQSGYQGNQNSDFNRRQKNRGNSYSNSYRDREQNERNERRQQNGHQFRYQGSYQNRNNDYSRQQENRHSDHNRYQERHFESNQNDPEPSNFYEILGVQRNAKAQDIEAAFRKMAIAYGLSENPEIKKRFQKILEAYLLLSDPEMRANYDKQTFDTSASRNTTYETFAATFKVIVNLFNKCEPYLTPILIGVGYILCADLIYIISKWSIIILYNVSKFLIKHLPAFLVQLGKLIYLMTKGSIFLLTCLAKCLGCCFKIFCRCTIG